MTSLNVDDFNLGLTSSPSNVSYWSQSGHQIDDNSYKLCTLVRFSSDYHYNIEDLVEMRAYAERILLLTSDIYEEINDMIKDIQTQNEQGFYEKRDAQD